MSGYSKAAHYKNYGALWTMNNATNIEELLRNLKEESAAVPSETFRTNARIRIINTVTNPHPLRASWYQRPRVLGYTVGTAIATVVFSVGTVYAAQSSLPNSTLYPIKVFSEQAALTLSPTSSIKTTVVSTIVARRIDEIQAAQKQGDQKEIDASITNFDDDISALQKRKDISQESLHGILSTHQTFINSLKHRGKEENDKHSEAPKSNILGQQSEVEQTPTLTITPDQTATIAPIITKPEIKLPQAEGISPSRHEDD